MQKVLTRAEKISKTMRLKKINNFSAWRVRMEEEGRGIKYLIFPKNGDLAELCGVVLGDGHIWAYPRTEELSIFSNANNPGFIRRYSDLIEKLFGKKPILRKHGENCVRIRIYQKNISDRLEVPLSPRGEKRIIVPNWIFQNKTYTVRYLRGLYEAEGCFCEHAPTYTHKALFSNKNGSMLKNVHMLLSKLGFHPHMDQRQVQLSRKTEVNRFRGLIDFRKY